jgi:glycogen operon protein
VNGWNNTDGTDDNRSWNCGTEGPSLDPAVDQLRHRMMKNAMAVLLMSRGTPMFLAGDEFANTQFGNNNGYCQDNEISWLNWEDLERNQDQYRFTRHMIRIRKAHPVLRKKTKPCSMGFADITVYEPEESTRALRILYAGKFEDGEDDLVFVVVNPYWEEQACLLPPLPEHMYWQVEANTQEGWYLQKCVYGRDMPDHQPVPVREPVVNAAPRSVMVLTPGKM